MDLARNDILAILNVACIFFIMKITIKKVDVKHKEHQSAHLMTIFIDALANAVTATRLDSSMDTLPPEPTRDMLGLPMQMVYSPSELKSKKKSH